MFSEVNPLVFLLLLGALVTQGTYADEVDEEPPLKFNVSGTDKDFSLRVGEDEGFSLIATSTYPIVFNDTDATLIFIHSSIIEPLPNINLTHNFHSAEIQIVAKEAGRFVLHSKLEPPIGNYSAKDLFLRIAVYKLEALTVICEIVGWLYFVAWSFSFYPQVVQNFRRKSVRGLSFEFVSLNITGFTVYSIYNVGLYWVPSIQDEYYDKDPTGVIPVQINDVIFSLHAVIASGIIGLQCLLYDRGSQTLSYSGRSLLCGIGTFLFVMFVVTVSNAITWLSFLNCCSYVKLFITLVKYVPQAYLNYTRKSTSGWCIGNVLLDFTGGVFSMVQMLMISYNHNDWYSIFGDFTKFGLGLFSITFDIFFMIQHYILYRNHREYEPIEGCPDPIINHHEDMVTSNHVIQSSYDENEVPHSSSVDSIPHISANHEDGYQTGGDT